MTSNDRPLDDEVAATACATDGEELAELVDDAVKAVSIGGTFQTDNEVRRAVDRLKLIDAGPAER